MLLQLASAELAETIGVHRLLLREQRQRDVIGEHARRPLPLDRQLAARAELEVLRCGDHAAIGDAVVVGARHDALPVHLAELLVVVAQLGRCVGAAGVLIAEVEAVARARRRLRHDAIATLVQIDVETQRLADPPGDGAADDPSSDHCDARRRPGPGHLDVRGLGKPAMDQRRRLVIHRTHRSAVRLRRTSRFAETPRHGRTSRTARPVAESSGCRTSRYGPRPITR